MTAASHALGERWKTDHSFRRWTEDGGGMSRATVSQLRVINDAEMATYCNSSVGCGWLAIHGPRAESKNK